MECWGLSSMVIEKGLRSQEYEETVEGRKLWFRFGLLINENDNVDQISFKI